MSISEIEGASQTKYGADVVFSSTFHQQVAGHFYQMRLFS